MQKRRYACPGKRQPINEFPFAGSPDPFLLFSLGPFTRGGIDGPFPGYPLLWAMLGVIPILLGVISSIRNAWVCDDAFISFRYVDHFERGLGLVYNAGERVEGYTHFLWVVLLAAVHRTGFDLVDLGRHLSLFFHLGTLGVLLAWSLGRATSPTVFLPLAAWGVALHPDMQIWASGGLETAAFTFCMLVTVLSASRTVVRPGAVATFAALAALFRPEGLLLGVCVAGMLC